MSGYSRFVALGDSQTEGLNDLRPDGTPRGWADRFAERLAETSPGLTYANLVVRACRARHVRDVQLPRALELAPDLASVVVGMNDVLRHDYDLDETVGQVEETFAALVGSGADVVTMTFPDIDTMLPVMARLAPRQRILNDRLREAAGRHGVAVLELAGQPLNADPLVWSHDRIHGSAEGHARVAEGMAELMGLPGTDPSWNQGRPGAGHRLTTAMRDAKWVATFLLPFLYRQVRGVPAEQRVAKRLDLTPVEAPAPLGSRRGC